ncbi:MAG: DedA family protein [Gemmataceae bacterium]|nr:DedA family protein [Gemmataceae bacterium]
MEQFIDSWGHLGVFLAILATGLGFPMPEELPVVLGGAMAHSGKVYTWTMLPVCIVGVIIGDSFLYLIGRFWGSKLIEISFIRKKLLTPERFAKIADNFKKYGVGVLLFARFTPGFRTPIFLTAGITKMPIMHFLLADGIYAIPGVSILFFLGYWFTDSILELVKGDGDSTMKYAKPIIVLVVLAGVGLYILYRIWRKPMVEGNPTEMPPIVGPVTEKLDQVAESMADKVLHRTHPAPPPVIPAENNGEVRPSVEEKKPANQ